jgi:hypothetical protein
MIPTVIIVGADKGGVGKTTLARVLVDYLADRQVAARVFDCQAPGGDLKRFATDAEIVDISEVRDQMKVFDGLEDGKVAVLDLPAGLLSPTLQALDDARLLEDVRAGKMRLVLLHVLGPTVSSIAEISMVMQRISGGAAKHYLVKNHINRAQFFDFDANNVANDPALEKVTIKVPQLTETACEMLQVRGGSFASFAHEEKGQSRMLSGLVRGWLEKVWSEFDRVGLKDLLASG